MLLKPMPARSPRSFRNVDNKCFLGVFFLNNSNKKVLAPHAVGIHSWNLSNYYLTVFHICRTIRRHFSLRQVKLCIGQRKYKQKFMTQGRKEWPSEWIRARSVNSYFAFCKIVVKTNKRKQRRDKVKGLISLVIKLFSVVMVSEIKLSIFK